jgi:hypothetical protein
MVEDINNNIAHEVAELICLKCLKRAIHVYSANVPLKDLECECGAIGYLIKTGQTINDDTESVKECKSCLLFENGKCKLGLHNSDEFYCGYYKK